MKSVGLNGGGVIKPQGVSLGLGVLLWSDSDQFAGTEKHICELEQGLRKLGVAVRVACPHPTPMSAVVLSNGGDVVSICSKGISVFRAILDVSRMLWRRDVDVVHSHNGRTALMGAMACLLDRRGLLVVSQHFIRPARTMRGPLLRKLASIGHRWLGERVSQWIAVSVSVRREMVRRGDAVSEQISIVSNAVSRRNLPAIRELRSDRGVLVQRDSRPTLVCVARLVEEKGHRTLFSALDILRREGCEFVVWLVGDGRLRCALEAEVKELGLESRVIFAGHQSEPEFWLDAADFLVLSSPEEPFGLVLLEAMSRSKAVVAARSGGPLEIVKDQLTGLLFEPGDVRDLAAKIQTLLRRESLRGMMGAAGFDRWGRVFSLEKMSSKTMGVYTRANQFGKGSPRSM